MPESEPPKRRRLNADGKRALRSAEVRVFLQQYQRKAERGLDPNDRHYDRDVEARLKRMKPDELDRLIREDE